MNISDYYGFWEPSHIGPRAELDEIYDIQLWRGSEVLKTTYKTEERNGKLYVLLGETELRYTKTSDPYATIKECYFEGDTLTVVENFPISSDSTDTYKRTKNNRYGNFEIADATYLPLLEGVWSCGSAMLKIQKDKLYFGYDKDDLKHSEGLPITVLKCGYNDEISIHHINPSVDMLHNYNRIVFRDKKLYATIPVCDAPSFEQVFEKTK